MKTYRRHQCTKTHRTYHTLGKCMFPKAIWVQGEGPYACLAWCRILSVTLWETEQQAHDAKTEIDRYGCGGMCNHRHEVVRLELDQPATPPPPPAPPPAEEDPPQPGLW